MLANFGKKMTFTDVALTFFLTRQQKGSKTKFINIAKSIKKKFAGSKIKHTYIAGKNVHLPKIIYRRNRIKNLLFEIRKQM
jgi:hypothetical protein